MASKPKPDPALKDIKIKTGVVKRLAKERDMYIKEANTQEAKIQKMKDEGQDEYNIKKQVTHIASNVLCTCFFV
jgi:tubulin-specific chaperone A